MANTRKITLLWEDKQIIILEVDRNQPVQSQVIDLSPVYSDSSFSIGVTEDIQIVALIQKTLRDMRIEATEVCLAVANHNVILRSFIVPMLSATEIQTAVQFEAKKYIPFDLSELKYTFHTIPIVENKIKRYRVVFYAVRKDLLDKYERVLKQVGLSVTLIEPSASGFVRTMINKKDITADARAAVLDVDQTGGRIYFIDKSLVVFIREFFLNDSADPELFRLRLFNEIRNSLDFYSRQYHEQIDQVMVTANDEIFQLTSDMAIDLSVTMRRYQANIVTPGKILSGIGILSCFGLTLNTGPSLDLLVKQKVIKEPMFQGIIPVDFDIKEFIPAIQLFGILLVICGGIFVGTYVKGQEIKKQVDALASQQGEFESQSTEDIQSKITQFQTDTEALKKVRYKTDLYVLTALISNYLGNSMWINGLNVTYSADEVVPASVSVEFQGNVYLPDVNAQIKAINDFVAKLRDDKKLAKYFTKIQLLSIERKQGNGVTYTTFMMKCL